MMDKTGSKIGSIFKSGLGLFILGSSSFITTVPAVSEDRLARDYFPFAYFATSNAIPSSAPDTEGVKLDATQNLTVPKATQVDQQVTDQVPTQSKLEEGLRPSTTPAKQVVQSKECLPLSEIVDRDGDIKRAGTTLTDAKNICASMREFSEGGVDWIIQIYKNTAQPGPLWALPHDNEQAAFQSGIYAVIKYGGTMVAVETGGQRNAKAKQGRYRQIDPNRNFSISQPCAAKQNAVGKKYTAAFFDHLAEGQPVIALHTNSKGGGLVFKRKDVDGEVRFPALKDRFKNNDTFAYVSTLEGSGKGTKKLIDTIKKAGINVIMEKVTLANNDCSMSKYSALNQYDRYINIEVPSGSTKTQKQMIDLLVNDI